MQAANDRVRNFLTLAQIGESIGSVRSLAELAGTMLLALLQHFVNLDRLWPNRFLANVCGDWPMVLWIILCWVLLKARKQTPSLTSPGTNYSMPLIEKKRTRRLLTTALIAPAALIILRYLFWVFFFLPQESPQILIHYPADTELAKALAAEADQSINDYLAENSLPRMLIKAASEAKPLEKLSAEYQVTILPQCVDSGECRVQWFFATPSQDSDLQLSFTAHRTQGKPLDRMILDVLRVNVTIARCANVNPLGEETRSCYRLLRLLSQTPGIPQELGSYLLKELVNLEVYARDDKDPPETIDRLPLYQALPRSEQLLLQASQLASLGELSSSIQVLKAFIETSCGELRLEPLSCVTQKAIARIHLAGYTSRVDPVEATKQLRAFVSSSDIPGQYRSIAYAGLASFLEISSPEDALEIAPLIEAYAPNQANTSLYLARFYRSAGQIWNALYYSTMALFQAKGDLLKAQVAISYANNLNVAGCWRCGTLLRARAYALAPSLSGIEAKATDERKWWRYHAVIATTEAGLRICAKSKQSCLFMLEDRTAAHAKLGNLRAARETLASLETLFASAAEMVVINGEEKQCMYSIDSWYCNDRLEGLRWLLSTTTQR